MPEATNQKSKMINISTWSVVKVALVILVLYFLYLIKSILIILFISVILSSLIDPLADWFTKKRIPRSLAVISIYLVLLAIIVGIAILLIPPIIEQVKNLVSNFPAYWDKLAALLVSLKQFSVEYGFLDNIKNSLTSMQGNLAGGIFTTINGFFNGVVAFFAVIFITFYLVIEEDSIKKVLRSITPTKHHLYLGDLISRMRDKLGLWLRGQMILSLIVGALSYIGLTILGVEYALILAILAGVAETVPYLGPILSAIPAIFIALTQSPLLALLVLILYFVIQQLENNLLVPKVMQKTVGLNPIISIVALLIGAQVGGIIGVILAIPVAIVVTVFIQDFFKEKNEANNPN